MRVKNVFLGIRISDDLLAAVKIQAVKQDRSVSGYIRRLLIENAGRPMDSRDGRATADDLGIRQIQLTRGMIALVDDEDFDRVNQHKWSCMNHGAAQARIGTERVQMHRFILGLAKDDKTCIDHINHNRLDNRRCNLRLATKSQNCGNRVIHKNNLSRGGYKGVIDRTRYRQPRNPRIQRFRAQITHQGTRFDLGTFATPEQAARAYDAKARELYGEFALLNFPDETQDFHATTIA